MTNTIAILIFIPLTLLSAYLLLLSLTRDRNTRLSKHMALLQAMILGWELATLLYFSTSNSSVARYIYDLKLPFVIFSALAMFILMLNFYHMDKYTGGITIALLSILPVIVTILSLTSPLHNFIRETIIIDTSGSFHQETNIRGVWFWIHTVFCYSLMLGMFVLAIYQHNKLPGYYRKPSTLMLFGISVSLLFNMLSILPFRLLPIDISLVGIALSTAIVYNSTITNRDLDAIIMTRHKLFDYMHDGIIVLDDERNVIDINPGAKAMLEKCGHPFNQALTNYDDIKNMLFAASVSQKYADDAYSGTNFVFNAGDGTITLNVREKALFTKNRQLISEFALIQDVTADSKLIEELEIKAGMDALTGLPNRRSMEVFLKQHDCETYLPLVIISGDINGLKQVNDALGHQQGDVLLRLAGEVMLACCPSNGYASRIGGDEFMILAPNSSHDQAQTIIESIQLRMRLETDYPFTLSMALGYALKSTAAQPIEEVLDLADTAMYEDKKSYENIPSPT